MNNKAIENNVREYCKHINLKKILIMLLFGMFMQFFSMIIVTEALESFADVSLEYSETIDNLTRLTLKMVLYVCIVAPFVEEMCFRGVIMQAASALKLPFFAANIIQAAAFSLFHDNIVQKVYAFILGLLIGFFVHSLKNILYGIAFHASLNLTGVIVNNFFEEIESIFLKIAIVLVTGICMVILYKILYKKNNSDNNNANVS